MERGTPLGWFALLTAVVALALGVAALIVILSVMNGFEGELRNRLLSMTAHGTVTGSDGVTSGWREMRQEVELEPGIAAAAPLVSMEGMIQSGRDLRAVMINGVDPEYEAQLSGHLMNIIEGNLDVLGEGSRSIILGRLLAYELNVRIGDGVVLLIPRPVGDGTMEPVLERFVMRGVFEAGLADYDATLALINARDAAEILGLGDEVSAIRFRADDVMQAPTIANRIESRIPGSVSSDWTIENASYFRAIRIEKMMMSLILSLFIGVAAFNIVASLVMVVTDKTSDIAVLRTLGMGPNGVVRVFFVQGAVIGWAGVFFGVILGVIIAIYVPVIVPVLEGLLGFQIMPGDVYYVSRIPSELDWKHVSVIAVSAFVLTSLATLYPARRAALVNPAVALRYE